MSRIIIVILIVMAGCNSVPKYFKIEDILMVPFSKNPGFSGNCDTLTKRNILHYDSSLYILWLFSVNYVDENGQGDNRYFEPGGYGENGILKKIKAFTVELTDSSGKAHNLSDSIKRLPELERVYVRGKGLLNYTYDRDCQPLGIPFQDIKEFISDVNSNSVKIQKDNLSYRGMALGLSLKGLTKGEYVLASTMEFETYKVQKKENITIY